MCIFLKNGHFGPFWAKIEASDALYNPRDLLGRQGRGCGTVVARPLCMRKVRGSTPRISIADFEWSRVRLTLGANFSTYSSVVERSIADLLFLSFVACIIGLLSAERVSIVAIEFFFLAYDS